eukprot:NODE_168_length_16247_cov_0.199591.p2 type:complete len:463 gc:universal NODE_168_length_16247_cov_0.199591:7672-9060(+)
MSPFKLQDSITINHLNLRPWRLNLITSFMDRVYIASHNVILQFNSKMELLNTIPIIKAKDSGYTTTDPGTDEYGPTINAITSGFVGSLGALVTVIDDGGVIIYDIHSLNKPLYYFNEVSCWGVDIHKNGLLAVSNNSHNIRVWKISNSFDSSNPTTWFSKLEHKYMPYTGSKITETYLNGHAHNIPCISISTCGKFLVSASIDKSCRVWDIEGGKCIAIQEVSEQWGWLSKCISHHSAKIINNETFQKCILSDIGASTSTSYPALNRTDPLSSNPDPWDTRYPRVVNSLAANFQQLYHFSEDESTSDETNSANLDVTQKVHNFENLILYGSKYDLFLYKLKDSGLSLVYSCSNVVRGLHGRRQVALLEHFDRLCLMQVIDELGIVVVASQQGSGCVLQINASSDHQKYYLNTISTFHGSGDIPLAGISVLPKYHDLHPILSYYLLYVLYMDGSIRIYRLNIE